MRVIAGYGFREMGLHRIQLSVSPFNLAGIRACQKAGFTGEGRQREAVLHDGRWYGEVLMSILDHECGRPAGRPAGERAGTAGAMPVTGPGTPASWPAPLTAAAPSQRSGDDRRRCWCWVRAVRHRDARPSGPAE